VICTSLEASGIATTFPIQALTLPLAMGGHDIIGQARTGTGKTLAFGVPILHRLAADLAQGADGARKAPFALIVLPTRELAIQVAAELNQAGKLLGARVLTVYGGRAYEPQIDALKAGVDIVVGTPGRLLDLADRRNLDLSQVRALVLDEADKMLDLGFLPDVEKILRLTPDDRQTMLFSATMPGEVVTLARRHMRRATNIRAESGDEVAQIPPLTTQHVYRTHHLDKIEVLARLLQAKDRGLAMVFCQTKRAVDQVSAALDDRGFATGAVHGDLGQGQRERALRAFRSGKVDVLVATDVAARGIDVDDVTHVVNYECPDDEKTYVHRIGRTGRAGREGVAVTFVDWADLQRWKLINAALGLDFPDPAETYSTSEHLYAALSIPPDATGKLPVEMRARAGLAAEAEEDLGETGRIRSKRSRSVPDDRDGGRSGSRGKRRKHHEQADDLSAGGSGAARDDRPEADGDAAPARSRRRRRLRSGQEVGQQADQAAEQELTEGGGTAAGLPDAPSVGPDSARPDSARPDSARPDSARMDSARMDSARMDSARPDSARMDSARPDDDRPADDRPEARGQGAPRKRTARRGTVRRDEAGLDTAQVGTADLDAVDVEDDEAFARPIVASDPVTLPAAPGVPAVIFQAPV
jgi:superfamily II DNA/RNA helicase